MRDPGTSRPNPLFAHETVGDADDEAPSADGPAGSEWARLDELLSSGSAAEAVVTAMIEAGPEALEHLMNAGQELLLAAKAMLDAAERGLEAHRRAEASTGTAGGDDTETRDANTDDDADDDAGDDTGRDAAANVTRLDLG